MLVPIIIAVMAITVGVFAIIMVIQLDKQARASAALNGGRSKGLLSITQWLRIAKFYEDFFLTRDGYTRIKERVALLSIYTAQEVRVEAAKFYSSSLFITWGMIIAGVIVFRDLFNSMLVMALALVMKTALVDKQLEKVHLKLLKQLSITLSSIRQCYLRTGLIPDSVMESDKGYLLQRPLDEIYNILTLTNSMRRLDEFIATVPFKLLQTLAGVCLRSNEAGEQNSGEGSSVFTQALLMMSDEISLELRKLAKQKAKFGVLEIMPLCTLPAIFIIEKYFGGIIPGTSVMYNGLYGYISRTVITLLSIVGYYFITTVNRATTVSSDDRHTWVMSLLENEKFSDFIDTIKPKKFKKVYKFEKSFKGALSQKTLRDIYTEKVVYAIFGFVLTAVILFSAVSLARDFIYKNVGSLSLISSENLTQADIDFRRQVDREYLSFIDLPTKGWTTEFVAARFPSLMNMERDEQVHRLMTKYTSYHNTQFKWWMLLFVYLACLLATKIPEMQLKMRAWLLKTEEEEDVLQLQTIIVILMHTAIDTLDTIEWMIRQSKIHKDALIDAYHEYPSDPEFALDKLKDRSGSSEFKRMIEKLSLTIYQATLYEAFSDLQAERTQVLRLREITQETILGKKRFRAGWFAMAPLAALVVLHLLVPIGVIGFREFSSALANIKS